MSRQNNFSKGNIILPLLLVVIVGFAVLLTSGNLVNKSATDPNEQVGEVETDTGQSINGLASNTSSVKEKLQMKSLKFKPKPTPISDSCNHDMSKKSDPEKCQCSAWLVKCVNKKCVDLNKDKSTTPGTKDSICPMFDQNTWCDIFSKEGDGWYCIGKPVIYLYPEKPTLVDVEIKTEGKVVVSDPQIENPEGLGSPKRSEGGWKDVVAQPNGTLTYRGQQYRELFYETSSRTLNKPTVGLVFSTADIRTQLLGFITKLGLTRVDEQKEFLDWWIPRLENLNSPYIFVSILDDNEKTRLDKVIISPKPDTFIDFIAYFEPRRTSKNENPLVLPSTPKRIGFTAIEWGGVIGDY